MSSNQTALLTAIFGKACPVSEGRDIVRYRHLRHKIRVLGLALERLGLAEQDKRSGFGLRLEPRFMRIVVERGVRRPKVSAETATAIDRLLVALVFDKRVGDGKNIEFGCKVLASLSLLQKVGDQAWKPTPLMRELFIESCARQFAKERKQHLG